jgi:hypothetical protein
MATNVEIWRQGYSLEESEFEFAPARLWRKYRRKQRERNTLTAADRERPRDAAQAMSRLQQHLSQFADVTGVREEIHQSILDELSAGTLVAYGFLVEPEMSKEPSEIPIYMFERRFANWQTSIFKGRGREFVRVRLVDANQIVSGDQQPQSLPAPKTPKPIGRPSQRSTILAALESLENDEIALKTMQTKEACAIVRRRISDLTGHSTERVKGLSDETIRRLIHRV